MPTTIPSLVPITTAVHPCEDDEHDLPMFSLLTALQREICHWMRFSMLADLLEQYSEKGSSLVTPRWDDHGSFAESR
jgi:hypothetical protein